jgi:hypothetical protein
MYRKEVVTKNNSFLFWLFKNENLYYKWGLIDIERLYPKELGYTKKQLDILWNKNSYIIDMYTPF